MNHVMKGCAILILALSVTGCFSNSSSDDSDLDALITEIVKHNRELRVEHERSLNKGITSLAVTPAESGDTVTAELDQAMISVVVQRLFENFQGSYVIEDVSIHGTVSARFTNVPFIEALNRIVEGIGLMAEMDGGIMVVKPAFVADGESAYREVAIRNLSMDNVNELLNGIFPEDYADQGRLVNFGTVPGSNSVYLYGTPADVAQAAQMLAKADREAKHVSIEVLVVEFNRGDFEEYDSTIQDLVAGEFTWNLNPEGYNGIVGVDWAEQAGDLGLKVTSLKGLVEMLVSDQKARLISRPFISTLSGTQAHIEIVSERYVVVGSGTNNAETSDVTSGVILDITPTVLPDGKIRMDVSVEDSQFSSTNVQNVLSEVNKNAAQTAMLVNDGQTIVVGGLILNRRSESNEGFPFLRNIPLINMLTASMKLEKAEKEVQIYITPRIWEPSMFTPLIGPGALGPEDKAGIFRK